MTSDKRMPIVMVVSAALLALIAASTQGDAIAIPSDIREALDQNARNLDPIVVKWTWTMSHGSTPKQVWEQHFALEQGRFHITTKETKWRGQRKLGGNSEASFDGRIFYSGDGQQTSLWKAAVEKGSDYRMLVLKYFDCAGVLVPTDAGDLAAGHTLSKVLRMLDHGGRVLAPVKEATLDGHRVTCVQIETSNEWRTGALATNLAQVAKGAKTWAKNDAEVQHEIENVKQMQQMPAELVNTFYLDPQLNYAIRRLEIRYPDGTLVVRYDNSDFELVPSRALWLPRKCTLNRYLNLRPPEGFQFTDPPLYPEQIIVSQISTSVPSDEVFALSYTAPGTVVTDRTGPKGVVNRYIIPIPLESLTQAHWYTRGRTIFLAANVMVLIVLLAYYSRRRRKASR